MLYSELVQLYQELEKTTKRLEKTKILAEFIQCMTEKEYETLFLLIEGRIFPTWDERVIGVASKLVLKAIALATGANADLVEQQWKKQGNLGDVAEEIKKKKRQVSLNVLPLTIDKVFVNLQKIATMQGTGSVEQKLSLIVDLLINATPLEAKYIIRTVLEDLRIGLGEGTMRDAIVWANFSKELGLQYNLEKNEVILPENNRDQYNVYLDATQQAYDRTNDFAAVAHAACKGITQLQKIPLTPGKPCNVMLYPKAESITEAFKTVGTPAAFEYKYDGFRLQIHKIGTQVLLFTRRLENVTMQFPEIVNAVKEHVLADTVILDGEAVGYDPLTKKYVPFQKISQRIKRKYDITEMAKQYPMELVVFDILHQDGKDIMDLAFGERRALLYKIIKQQQYIIRLAEQILTSDSKEAEKFYQQALTAGEEGMMVKNITACYQPGRHVGGGVKIKPTLDALDVVIIGAEW
ncbi:MAG: ATP-dependent DNA ligase, partial [Candidatus Woesearchaeota archaeon]|nr:ATP-dependent DNA ligase [Candidatus Woesearchaeota archaeon]